MVGMSRSSKLWSLAWRACEELSSSMGLDPHDVMASTFLEALFDDRVVEVLRDYCGVDVERALRVVREVRGRIEEELG